MPNFSIKIDDNDREYLKKLVPWSLFYYFDKGANPASREVPQPPENSCLKEELGAFVTFTSNGNLRGCIGQIIGHGPLYQVVAQMAQAAAFDDPRFPPIQPEEMEQLSFEISIMGPVVPCPDLNKIEIGKHGLLIQKGRHRGLLLPQVAVEYDWDRETFLEHLCRKAGLEPGEWRSEDTTIYWFECVIVK